MKRPWDLFEKRIKNECEIVGGFAIKIPEIVRMIGGRKPIRSKGFFDFCLLFRDGIVALDCKVTEDRLWNIKEYVLQKKKVHQFVQLKRIHELGYKAGYLIWFRDYGQIVWCPVEWIDHCVANGILSIHPEQEGVKSQHDDGPINWGMIFEKRSNEHGA